MQLLDGTVVETDIEPRATLVLTFSNGQSLRAIEDTSAYECYQVHIAGRETIV